jgi:2-oxo-3-hexenedioate decarboxylase/2-keto-4-pentenoate hydratase
MTPEAAERAAGLLAAARRDRRPIAGLPADCRPATAAEGYRIQDAFVAASGDGIAGFKIGATSERAQRFLETDTPFAGCVLSRDLLDGPAELAAGRFSLRLIEPEFAVRLGRDLPARDGAYDSAAVADAVASLHPAIEVVTSGLADWSRRGVPSLIADNGVNGALVLGPACTEWRRFDLPRHEVELRFNGAPAGHGVGGNTLGGPMNALAWLANHRAARGLGLTAGQVVTTGVVTEFVELAAGDEAVSDFGALGEVRVRFTA